MSVLYIKGKDGKFVPIFTVKGADGSNGIDGAGIEDITYKSSEGLEDTYEITYTDNREPTYFTVTNGKAGKDGETPKITIGSNGNWYINGEDTGIKAQGEDGVSPTVEITEITGGHHVTITDASGPHEFDVLNGKDGEDGISIEHRWEGTTLYVKSASGESYANLKGAKGDTGKGFTIKKVYSSFDEMEGDKNGDDVEENEFVLISTDTEDPYNSQLYIKVKNDDGSCEYKLLTDLSGAQGIQGVGIQSIEKTASNGVVDTYTITYTDGNKTTFTVRNSENLNIENGQGDGAIQQKVEVVHNNIRYGKTTATGEGATALNGSTNASGPFSIAVNRTTKALQYGCFASGGDAVAGQTEEEFNAWVAAHLNDEKNAGHEFKYSSTKGYYVTVSGVDCNYKRYESYAMATGDNCQSKGRGCYAGGVSSQVQEGYGAGAFGWECIVKTNGLHPSFSTGGNSKSTGNCLYNIGFDNTLIGNYAFALGWGLKSTNENANAGKVLLGRFNEDLSPTYNAYSILELGDGKDDKNRYNVFHIYKKSVDKWKDSSNYNAELKSALTVSERLTANKGVSTNNVGDRSSVSNDGVQDGKVWKSRTSLSLGYENNIKSIKSITLGTYNNIETGCSLVYSIGDNNFIYENVSGSVLVGRSCKIYANSVYEFGNGLVANGGNKTILGRYNEEINYTDKEYSDGRGAYSVFEVGDGGYYDNDKKLHRFNVLQIYKNYKDAFGTVANDDGNTASYTAELKADLVAYGKRATFEYMTCYQTPTKPTDVLRLQDVGEAQLAKMYWHTVLLQNTEHNGAGLGYRDGKEYLAFSFSYTFLSSQATAYTPKTFSKWLYARNGNTGAGISMSLYRRPYNEDESMLQPWEVYNVNVLVGHMDGKSITFNYPEISLNANGVQIIKWTYTTVDIRDEGVVYFEDYVTENS